MSIEEIQKLPAGWRWAKLGDVCRVVNGSTPSSDIAEYWDGDICWITPTDLGKQAAHLISSSARKITKEGFASCGTERVPVGTVIMSSRAPIGHLGIATVPLCTNQGCKSFVAGDGIDSQFLFHVLKKAVPELRALGSGATFAEVSKSQVQAFEIPLPPLPEQKRIATILVEQMAAVEKARTAAEARLNAAKELPAAHLREVFESKEALGWPKKRLGDVLYLRNDIVHPYDKPKGNTTFVGLEHLQSGTGIRSGSVSVEMETLTGRKPKFYTGDIVYGYLRPYLNKVWVAEFDGLCSVDQYVYLVDGKQADTGYISWYMRSPLYLQRAPIDTSPGQLPRIRKEEVASVTIELPPIQEQIRIADQIEAKMGVNFNLAEIIKAELDGINKLPAALLRQAFSGEL